MASKYSLKTAYELSSPEEVVDFYDGWADAYDAELEENGYVTPERCATALAKCVPDKSRPIMDLGCGSGLSGLSLKAAGFDTIDGFDLSAEMLERAREKGVYRNLYRADLSRPLPMAEQAYTHAAAIGCLNPDYMPVTLLDAILKKLPSGGCLVFSLSDRAAADGTMVGRLTDLIDCGFAELLHRSYGDHLPGIDLKATVYLLRRR